MRRASIVTLAIVAGLAGVAVVSVRSAGHESRESGSDADVQAVKEAIPDLLSRNCELGTIPLTDSMGGIERNALVDEAVLRTPESVREIYASTVASEITQELLVGIESLRTAALVPGVSDCTFVVDSWSMVAVAGDSASAEVIGAFIREMTGGQVHDSGDAGSLTDAGVPLELSLQRENARWLLVEVTDTRPSRG